MLPTFVCRRSPTRRAVRIAAVIAVMSARAAFEPSAQSVLDPAIPPAAPPGAVAPADALPRSAGAAGDSNQTAIRDAAVPRRFRTIELGMGLDEAIEALKGDGLFAYRGPEDVSLLPTPNQSLIEAGGLSFVKRGYFQFLAGKLWVMILVLNPEKIDHYSIFTSLSAKYGKPTVIDPSEIRWEDGRSRLSLERPLTLRYMDMSTFSVLRDGAAAKESAAEIDRREFLGGL
jgi:hypothetical protein